MWQQPQQQQQTYLRGSSSQYPQQQAVHPVAIISTDNRAHQQPQQHYQQHYQQHRPAVMDLAVSSNSRTSRNMAEKQRRDNLNTHIAHIAELVPIVAASTKKLDKISVLRLACAFLRTQYTIGGELDNFLPQQFNEFDLEQFFLDCLISKNGFLFVVTSKGKIVYVSGQVEQVLGYPINDMLGKSLYEFVCAEDHLRLAENITPDGMKVDLPESLRGSSRTSESIHDNNSSSSDDSTSSLYTRENLSKLRRRFQIRMSQRTVSKHENAQYEWFEISGIFRLANACRRANFNGNKEKHRETAERSRFTTNDIIFAGIATLPKKQSITTLTITDVNKDEYVTRHLIDGRIIYCDHRVSIIAGYMSEEVSGRNAFAFMHKNDFRWTMVGLRQMYDHAETWGSSCYRLITKTGKFIYLRTHGYLEFDKDTKTVESFVCINTLVSEEEGIRLIREMKERYSAIASTSGLIPGASDDSSIELCSESSNPQCSLEDPKSSLDDPNCSLEDPKCNLENPTELEDAITHLISNLPSPAPSSVSEDFFSLSPLPNTQYVKAATLASRMPPVATSASKIDINKHDLMKMKGKGKGKSNCTAVKEFNNHKHTIGKYMYPTKAEASPISDSESSKPSGKSIKMLDMMETAHSSHSNAQNADVPTQSNMLATHKPNTNSCVSCNRGNAPQGVNVLNTQKRMKQQSNASMSQEGGTYNIKVECAVGTYNCRKEQKPQYFDDSASDSSTGSVNVETNYSNRGMLKRICSEEEHFSMHKKRPSNVYASTNTNEEQQDVSRIKCRTFANENKCFTHEFNNQYNEVNSQSLMTAESPSSLSLHEIGPDYQQIVDPLGNSLIVTNVSEELLQGLQDMKDDETLLSSDASPEFMINILNGLPNESTTDFKYNVYNDSSTQRSVFEDQMINKKLECKHIDLSRDQMNRESQINIMKQDPVFRTRRKEFSLIESEHEKQKEILITLQQDHRKVQANIQRYSISEIPLH